MPDPRADRALERIATPCPICGRPGLAKFKPFCSVRCADADLGHWLTGQYRVPGPEIDDEGESNDAARRVDPEDGVG